ncbi:MAG: hypothetical protein LQ350_002840 [Teloschistes chrysophthalmus]|nr:MAG: hypothetical protein LQ350_002840 [Niorma chrysophthalma]
MTKIFLSTGHVLPGKGGPVDTWNTKPMVDDKATPDKKSMPEKKPFPTQKSKRNKPIASPTKLLTSRQREQSNWRIRLPSCNALFTYFCLLTFVCCIQQAVPFLFNELIEMENPFRKFFLIWTAGLLWLAFGFLWWAFTSTCDWIDHVAHQFAQWLLGMICARARTLLRTLDHYINHDYRVSAAFLIMLEFLAVVWIFDVTRWESETLPSKFLRMALRAVLSIAIFLHTCDTLTEAVNRYEYKDNKHGAIKNQAPRLSKKDPKAPAQKKKNDDFAFANAKRLRKNKAVEDLNRHIELKILKDEQDEINRQRSLLARGNIRLSRGRTEEERRVMKAEGKILSAELAELTTGFERLEAEMGGLAPAVD